ncbi:MAG: hypothetical protein ACK2UO_07360 [Caldilineaceae bacterium]
MNTTSKAVLFTVGAYVVTLAIIIAIVAVAIVVVMSLSLGCSALGHALFVLWATIAGVCIASVIAVSVVMRKQTESGTIRTLLLAGYIAAVLASSVFFAFGLMVVFNC